MDTGFWSRVSQELSAIDAGGLTKPERVLHSPQSNRVEIGGRTVFNLCANNYLGLADDPRVIDAAIDATRRWGAGLASVRFICGTQEIHKQLERSIADYLGFEDTILFAAAFDANAAVFEPLLADQDAIVSDALNHASIIDGVRLSKARRYRFASSDMDDLDRTLARARSEGARTILIVTDGVFSMDGAIAKLDTIALLAERHGALVMVDDCHATGFIGEKGRGTAALCGVEGKIDILTGTLGKALGGGMGGFIAARQPMIDLMRQRARPYLFSNALAPSVCGAALEAISIAQSDDGDRRRGSIAKNAEAFRARMASAGFELLPGEHPIIPVLLHEAALAQRFSAELLAAGVLAAGFSFPVVPQGKARIRTQMTSAFTLAEIEQIADIFAGVGRKLGVI